MNIRKLNEKLSKFLENEEIYQLYFEDEGDDAQPIEIQGNVYFDRAGVINAACGYWEDSRNMDVDDNILKIQKPNTFVAALNFLKKFGVGVKKFK